MLENYLWIILVTFIAGVIGTGLGGAIGALFGRGSNKTISLLLSFAAGIMLGIVTFELMEEAILPLGKDGPNYLWLTILFVLIGYLVIYLLNTLIDKHTKHNVEHISLSDHPETADDLDELIHSDHYIAHKKEPSSKVSLFIAGVVMASAIALHNLPEGMVIGASYASDITSIISGPGFILALLIGFHNIPEGMAVSVPLISGGMKKWKGILVSALSGLPIVLGAVLGFAVGNISPIWLSISLSFASGAMIYVVFGELLPESILICKSKLPSFFILFGLLLGFLLTKI